MKKALIGIVSVLALALVVVLFLNARGGSKETPRAQTEIKSDCGNCPAASCCEQNEAAKTTE